MSVPLAKFLLVWPSDINHHIEYFFAKKKKIHMEYLFRFNWFLLSSVLKYRRQEKTSTLVVYSPWPLWLHAESSDNMQVACSVTKKA
ncbi:hypothetical protein EJB05_10077, partial [Eragrostis curvula]